MKTISLLQRSPRSVAVKRDGQLGDSICLCAHWSVRFVEKHMIKRKKRKRHDREGLSLCGKGDFNAHIVIQICAYL